MFLLESKDFRELLELLNSREVKYLLVGGYAVAGHGFPRFTADLDLWIEIEQQNAERVEMVLREFGFGKSEFKATDFLRPGYAIQLGRKPYRVDILTSIDAVEFASAYARRVMLKDGGLDIPMIGLEDLLKNKRASGRPHDLEDVRRLEDRRRKIPTVRRSSRKRKANGSRSQS
jgi:hypothetical protein